MRLTPVPLALLAACLWWGAAPRHAQSDARFVLLSGDDPGVGLLDTTEVEPVGGNTATTLGEQRRAAIQHALDIWGQALDSTVALTVLARFEDFPCDEAGSRRAAHASTSSYSRLSGTPGADPEVYYASALANHLSRRDLDPDEPELFASFNLAVDEGRCGFTEPWYLGLDAQGRTADLVEITLHEVAHGLGMASLVDVETGALPGGFPDSFTERVYDNLQRQRLADMDDAGRLAALTHVRNVVWDGPAVRELAAQRLGRGVWSIDASPEVAGFSRAVGRTNFGVAAMDTVVSGELLVGDLVAGCLPTADLAGKVLLVNADCREPSLAFDAQLAGAVGVLFVAPEGVAPWTIPPVPLGRISIFTIEIPVLTVAAPDASRLATQAALGQVTIELTGEPDRSYGTDALGQPYVAVTDRPDLVGLAHWDPMLAPDALMEPGARAPATHELDLTLALMRDMGWAECGNAQVEPPEDCDDGEGNDDSEPDACRTDCVLAHCGDGVIDAPESCDEGIDNGDDPDVACRLDCGAQRCGDGIVDTGEDCDEAEANGASAGSCRADCTERRCGDGLLDEGEQCDAAELNGDPDARCSAACEIRWAARDAGAGAVACDAGTCDAGMPDRDDAAGSDCTCSAPGGRGSVQAGAAIWLLLGVPGLLCLRRRGRPRHARRLVA